MKLPPGVFENATVTTVLIFLNKNVPKKYHEIKLYEYSDGNFVLASHGLSYERINQSAGHTFSFSTETSVGAATIPLGKIAKFSLGIKTSDDKRFISDEKKDENSYRLLRGKDVGRYWYRYADKWIWYKPELMMEKIGAGPRKLEYFMREKIMFRSITGGSIMATLDRDNFCTNDKVHILYDGGDYSLKFLLGVVNSSFMNGWIHSTFNDLLEIKINQLEQLPLVKIDFTDKNQVGLYDKVVESVESILDLNQKLASIEANSNEWNRLKLEIEKTDKKIDALVDELYNPTKQSIAEPTSGASLPERSPLV